LTARILALHSSASHSFSKQNEPALTLIAGEGVEGDAHCGKTVKHRSRVAVDPSQPNLRQVHLMSVEGIAEVNAAGFSIRPGDIGENITTAGIDLLGLPRGAMLTLGEAAVLEITGLRNPCAQLDAFQPGLMRAFLGKDADGLLVRKAGIMAIVREGGTIRTGDRIRIALPPAPHQRLERV
jgi:MOSC domain-containing protein YiiM